MYNLALFLSYPSAFIYLFFLLCGSHLVLIRYEVLLVTDRPYSNLVTQKLSIMIAYLSLAHRTMHSNIVYLIVQ